MPEAIEIAKYGNALRKTLLPDDNNTKPRLVNFAHTSNYFTHVNVNDMYSCFNQPLLDITYKGKNLYLIFQDSQFNNMGQPEIKVIKGNLGQKGRWLVEKFDATSNTQNYPGVHFRIDLAYMANSLQPEMTIFYQAEHYGRIDIIPNRLEFNRDVIYLAPAFVGLDLFTPEKWMANWSIINKGRFLRDVLMDQTKLCCGVGNYIFIELLYQLKCHPKIKIGHFSQENALTLYYILKKLFEDFVSGSRQKAIYRKAISPCGHLVVYQKMFRRTIFWVPAIQLYGAH